MYWNRFELLDLYVVRTKIDDNDKVDRGQCVIIWPERIGFASVSSRGFLLILSYHSLGLCPLTPSTE